MIPTVAPDRFTSTVPFYRAHRLRYPGALLARVAERAGLQPGARVLDLGCGPGFLAIGFAALGHRVVAIDPDAAMLAGAREEASLAGVAIDLREGSSDRLGLDLGVFDLVVMGCAFHWMDRAATLETLDQVIAPSGAIALFADRHERTPENAWVAAFRAVLDTFGGPESFSARRRGPEWTGHVATLLDSAFCVVETIGTCERRRLTLDGIVGRALSMSSTAPDALGDRRAGFEQAMRDRLSPLAGPDQGFSEVVEYTTILARRP